MLFTPLCKLYPFKEAVHLMPVLVSSVHSFILFNTILCIGVIIVNYCLDKLAGIIASVQKQFAFVSPKHLVPFSFPTTTYSVYKLKVKGH